VISGHILVTHSGSGHSQFLSCASPSPTRSCLYSIQWYESMHVAKMHSTTGIVYSDKIPSVESHGFCLQEYLAYLGWCGSNDPEHSTSTIIILLTLQIIPSTLVFLESRFSQLRRFAQLLWFYSRSSMPSLCCCESSFYSSSSGGLGIGEAPPKTAFTSTLYFSVKLSF
jgi:hypothetical protein